MADKRSALAGHKKPYQFAPEGTQGVVFSEIREFSLTQIAAWPETLQSVGAKVSRLADSDNAPPPGRATLGGAKTLMRVEPLKWWSIKEETRPACASDKTPLIALDASEGAVLDLSHSRTWLRLEGEMVVRLLNHFLPINLSDRAFPAGSVATTAMHHIGVTLWRDEDAFNLLLPRSFASSLFDLLTQSASQYGYKVT